MSFSVGTLTEIGKTANAFKPDSYLQIYEKMFESVRHMELSLLELGILDGGSLNAWANYFPYSRIAGIDLKVPALPPHQRIHMFEGDQADTAVLSRAAATVAPNGFDIIIDDCSHIGAAAKASFWYLFEHHLKPGAFYIIEDWGTGYIANWPDGRAYAPEPDSEGRMPSHDAGMVGFIKQLLDEVYPAPSLEPRESKFDSITLHWGLCIIRKAVVRPPACSELSKSNPVESSERDGTGTRNGQPNGAEAVASLCAELVVRSEQQSNEIAALTRIVEDTRAEVTKFRLAVETALGVGWDEIQKLTQSRARTPILSRRRRTPA